MPEIKKTVECVPNFSEGRDAENISKILRPFQEESGVKLLDCKSDKDHNRMVVTAIGDPKSLKSAVIKAVGVAIDVIDMRKHTGQHPRMGAVDVIPFIPIKNIQMKDAVLLSNRVADEVSKKFNLPVFLYEASATSSKRENLANIRKGEFEKMAEKIKQPEWKPDYGESTPHKTAGVTAIGARMPLVAFNVNLKTSNIDIASQIAKNIRHTSGGLRYCKGIGIELKERGIVQVSMNMTDYTKTALYRSFELIKIEAKRYGVSIVGSEIIGLLPMSALIDSAVYYMGIENFSIDQVLEQRFLE